MAVWKKVIVSGSNAELNALSVSNSITASIFSGSAFTGSLFGTSSWATRALTASFLPVGTYAITSSWATNALTASYLSGSISSTPGGLNTQIQFNSASAFQGLSTFTFNYISESLQQGNSVSATGQYSHAEGDQTTATGYGAHAEGSSTSATGILAHAEGEGALALGTVSHAEGSYTQAIGYASHAEGEDTSATGDYSHAEGLSAVSTGYASHAEGEGTETLGYASHAEGYYTVASGAYQHVQGQYNLSSSAQSAFIIGNGIDGSNRRNLVFASGSEFQITGSLRVSGSITGSLFGTSSWAINALTASRAISSSYATNADNILISPAGPRSYYIMLAEGTSSYDSPNADAEFVYTAVEQQLTVKNLYVTTTFTASNTTITSITGSLFGTASWARNALTASYISGSIGGTPGGANKTIQFNGAGAFSGSNNFTFDSSSNQVQLTGSLIVSGTYGLNTSNATLYDGAEVASVIWWKRELRDTTDTIVVDWNNKALIDSSTNQSVDWENRVLSDNGTITSVNWNDRVLVDPGGTTTSIDWSNRYLYDQYGNVALLYSDTGSSDQVRLYGTASFAITASHALNAGGSTVKAGSGSAASFGGTPRTASITFTTPFSNNLYAITVTGEDARSWTIQSKVSGSFVINSNSSTALTGPVYWIATPFANS